MLLHLDGSTHPWLSLCRDRKDDLVLMDDASSRVYEALMVEEEDTLSSMMLLRDCVRKHGSFCALYTDRGSHFALTPKERGQVDRSRPTQIGRALNELHIESIYAYSPQARGRSERLFGTWQGRLPQELRLRGIKDRDNANAFIYTPDLVEPITVPSSKVDVVVPFHLDQGDDLTLTLDFDAQASVQVNETSGNRTYLLRPVINLANSSTRDR